MGNLIEELQVEIERNKELIVAYESISVCGACGAAFIKRDIEYAEKALAEIDAGGIAIALDTLRLNN